MNFGRVLSLPRGHLHVGAQDLEGGVGGGELAWGS